MSEIIIGRYRHYKGNEYTVLGTARHSETLEELVVYRQEYGEHGLWVRPKQMFSRDGEGRWPGRASISALGVEQRASRRKHQEHLR